MDKLAHIYQSPLWKESHSQVVLEQGTSPFLRTYPGLVFLLLTKIEDFFMKFFILLLEMGCSFFAK